MKKLDHLGWVVGLSFESFGLRIGIRANQTEVLEHAARYLLPHSVTFSASRVERLYSFRVAPPARRRGVRHYHCLFADEFLVARSLDIGLLVKSLCIEIERFVAEHARNRVFVHAGAVIWKGRPLILPGSSGSGKSTLVSALVANGATELSDEFAVFDRRGRVHPYPRPKPGAARPGADPGEDCLARGAMDPQSPPLVAVLRYRPGGHRDPRQLPRSRALLELLAHTVSARGHPARALATLAAVVRSATAVEGPRGEARTAAPWLLRLLESAPGIEETVAR